MTSNHGKICRDLVGGSLRIKDCLIIDKYCDMTVNHATTRNLNVRGDLTVEGNITAAGGGGGDNALYTLVAVMPPQSNFLLTGGASGTKVPFTADEVNEGWTQVSPGEWSPPVDGTYYVTVRLAAWQNLGGFGTPTSLSVYILPPRPTVNAGRNRFMSAGGDDLEEHSLSFTAYITTSQAISIGTLNSASFDDATVISGGFDSGILFTQMSAFKIGPYPDNFVLP